MKVKNLRKVVRVRKAVWDDRPNLTNCTFYCISVALVATLGLILLAA